MRTANLVHRAVRGFSRGDRNKRDGALSGDPYPPSFTEYGVYSPPRHVVWQEAWQITEHALRTLKEDVERDGSELLIVILTDALQIIPDPMHDVERLTGGAISDGFNVDYPSNRIARFAEATGIPSVNLLPVFRKYRDDYHLRPPYFSFDDDGHWNRLGHRVAADTVGGYIRFHFLATNQ
jgi:hypothetical protein